MMTGTFVDYQFKTITLEAFPEKEELTIFFAKFYGRLSIVSPTVGLGLSKGGGACLIPP